MLVRLQVCVRRKDPVFTAAAAIAFSESVSHECLKYLRAAHDSPRPAQGVREL